MTCLVEWRREWQYDLFGFLDKVFQVCLYNCQIQHLKHVTYYQPL